jgi:ribonucleoside-diphosphate reductase beta chain
MALLDTRVVYSPFEYEQAYNYWLQQQQAHWLHSEVNMNGDINDWKFNLTDSERFVIGHILKGFVQAEVIIGDFWSNKVTKWFKKPEIQMMANTFSAFESIHAVSYAYLNQSLGLEDFSAFLSDPTTKAKIDRLIETGGKSHADIARSLAIFSAFNEGVNLFSSFAILLNFKRFNKLKGVGTIIEFSVRDESLHSEAGCWLFRTFVSEYSHVWTDEMKKDIYDAARLTVSLEDDYIEQAFSGGPIEGIDKDDLKQYIRFRANAKLVDLGLKKNWKNVDMAVVTKITSWFDPMVSGTQLTDFFSGRSTNYSRGVVSFKGVWADK